jgi:hypothetical protein
MLDGFKLMWRDKITYEAIRPISAIRTLYKDINIQVRLLLGIHGRSLLLHRPLSLVPSLHLPL